MDIPAESPTTQMPDEIEKVVQHLYAAGLALTSHRNSIANGASTDQLDHALDLLDRLLTDLTAPRVNAGPSRAV